MRLLLRAHVHTKRVSLSQHGPLRVMRIAQGHARLLSASRTARLGPGIPSPFGDSPEADDGGSAGAKKENGNANDTRARMRDIGFKAGETGAVMLATLVMLGLAGLAYHRGYRSHTIRKMSSAFDGSDPIMELKLSTSSPADEDWVSRNQQALVDQVVAGDIRGRYYVLFGEKGTGKTSMLIEAIKKVQGRNVVVMEAHADPEIFRIRMGKALNFDFFEDYLGSLFSIRGPRENTAILDIERAINVLEYVAVDRVKRVKRPLVFVINNAHLIRNDADGNAIVELLQQKAEALASAGLVTFVFNSDDYWLYERLKRLGTRMEMVSVSDFTRQESYQAIRRIRRHTFGEGVDDQTADMIYRLVGGRAQHLAAVASKPDMVKACHVLIDREKQWFLNHCALLGEDMDDDVMEYGKFSSAAMVLARAFVRMDEANPMPRTPGGQIHLPRIPLWRARQIMTRPDYIQQYDNLNFFTLDDDSKVKPDSVVMMHAFREIASMPGFNELLEQTLDRVSAIESLGRTRELVLKDLVLNSKYLFENNRMSIEQPPEEGGNDDDEQGWLLDRKDRFYWKGRHSHFEVAAQEDEKTDADRS